MKQDARKHLIEAVRRTVSTSYWVFQANPRTGDDLRNVLKSKGKIGWWRLTRFRDPRKHIRSGDKIVLWQVEGGEPAAAGVYALGEITKAPIADHGKWKGYYRLSMIRDLDNPISPRLLRSDPVLRKIPVFKKEAAQGSNFRITREQWERIASHFPFRAIGSLPKTTLKPISQNYSSPDFVIVDATEAHEMELRERRLVRDYQRYMDRKKARLRPYAIRFPDENTIACDLYDKRLGNLIEAKSTVCRNSVRMAIGQLADYSRFIPAIKRAVLLPYEPSEDLKELLNSQSIYTIWQTEAGKFADNSADSRFT